MSFSPREPIDRAPRNADANRDNGVRANSSMTRACERVSHEREHDTDQRPRPIKESAIPIAGLCCIPVRVL